MENPLIAAFTHGLTRAGHPSLRFNFPYKEKGLKTPDRPEILEDAWATVCRHFPGQTGIGVTHVVAADR
jgi:predicted alpha/beta-hydrolase family hydrolase